MAKLEDVIQRGTNAARPAATAVAVGTLYYDTDNSSLARSNGTSWESVEGGASGMTNPMTTQGDIISGGASGAPGRLAIGTAGQVLTVNAGATAPEWAAASGGGGGGPESIERFDAAAAPGSPNAANDEFEDASITGWTRVHNSGTPKGTWSENYGALSWRQTATGATELDVYAKAHSPSVGDTVEVSGRIFVKTASDTLGIFVGFTNGTTFGTSNAVGTFWHDNLTLNRFMLNQWPGHNSRSTDGTILNGGSMGTRWYVRVKYEAANTWGLYISPTGDNWHTVQSNFAYTLTPTHIAVGVAMLGSVTAPSWVVLDYVRVNAA